MTKGLNIADGKLSCLTIIRAGLGAERIQGLIVGGNVGQEDDEQQESEHNPYDTRDCELVPVSSTSEGWRNASIRIGKGVLMQGHSFAPPFALMVRRRSCSMTKSPCR